MGKSRRQERIVLRGVNWLGDAVMTMPALRRLREAKPEAHLALLTTEKLEGLWTEQPEIDEVIAFRPEEGVGKAARRIKEGQFDIGVAFPNSFRSGLELWLAGVPRRVGYEGNGRRLILNERVQRSRIEVRMHKRTDEEVQRLILTSRSRDRFPPEAHQMHHYLRLVETLGASARPLEPRITVTGSQRDLARTRWEIDPAKPVVGLNAGAEYGPAKRWPLERFVEAARIVEAGRPVTWLILGGKGDIETAANLEKGLREAAPGAEMRNIAGKTSLKELCATLSLCDVVLTNDTGPMHVAAAAGARVVVPFGSTSPELTGPGLPGSNRQRFLLGEAQCAPCFRRECPIDFRCMQSIGAAAAALEIIEILRGWRSGTAGWAA